MHVFLQNKNVYENDHMHAGYKITSAHVEVVRPCKLIEGRIGEKLSTKPLFKCSIYHVDTTFTHCLTLFTLQLANRNVDVCINNA